MTALLDRQAEELTRRADRHAMPIEKYFLRFGVDGLHINVEVDEATYRHANADEFGTAPDCTHPIEPTWWNTRFVNDVRVHREGWTQ